MKIHLQRHFAICINMPLKSENGQKLHIGPFCSEATTYTVTTWLKKTVIMSNIEISFRRNITMVKFDIGTSLMELHTVQTSDPTQGTKFRF